MALLRNFRRAFRQRPLVAATLILACGGLAVAGLGTAVIRASSEPAGISIDVTASGLPTGLATEVWEVNPDGIGGYRYHHRLARGSGHMTIETRVGAVIQAGLVPGGKWEVYRPAERFQRVMAPNERIIFDFHREFFVSIAKWSSGPSPLGRIMGDTSMESEWVPAGTIVNLSATPAAGYRFTHWGVFEVAERMDHSRSTSTGSTLTLRVDRPLQILAGFLPI